MHEKVPQHNEQREPSTEAAAREPEPPRSAPEALLRLQRSAGNAATALLLQRIPVTSHDKKVLKKVRDRKAVEEKIREIPESQEADWRKLSAWFTDRQTKQELAYLADLYHQLLAEEVTLDDIAAVRDGYARALQTHATIGGQEQKQPDVKPQQTTPQPGHGIGKDQLASALGGLRPAAGTFNQFPQAEQAFLLNVFQAYRRGQIASWADLYENYYKISDRKRRMHRPNADAYVASIHAEDQRRAMLGEKPLLKRSTREEAWKTGEYPIATMQATGIGHRIYLNVHVAHAAEVYGHVHELPGVNWAKLGSHELVSTVRDSIVLYTKDEGDARHLFTLIGAYQNEPLPDGGGTKALYFVNEIVRMTQPAPRLIGVSHSGDLSWEKLTDANKALLASERGKRERLSKRGMIGRSDNDPIVNLSFSQLRAMLIYTALLSSNNNQQKFEQDVVSNFRTAGIGSAAPWEGGRATPDLIYLLRDLIYNP